MLATSGTPGDEGLPDGGGNKISELIQTDNYKVKDKINKKE